MLNNTHTLTVKVTCNAHGDFTYSTTASGKTKSGRVYENVRVELFDLDLITEPLCDMVNEVGDDQNKFL